MLAGIMRGMQYDSRAMSGIELLCKHGIPSRDQPPTHFWRAVRAISRASAVQKRTIQAHDVELQTAYKQLTGLQTNVQTQTVSLKRAKETGKGIERAYKKLCKTNKQMHTLQAGLGDLQSQSSGTVPIPELNQCLEQDTADSSVFTMSHNPNPNEPVPHCEPGPPQSQESYYHYLYDSHLPPGPSYHPSTQDCWPSGSSY
ncbi:hypothetical protein K439DRAFT_403058 [Ramaria rubella]|nr:hypothetical protein K439DRAFT_403058 [Ramaria rubella]